MARTFVAYAMVAQTMAAHSIFGHGIFGHGIFVHGIFDHAIFVQTIFDQTIFVQTTVATRQSSSQTLYNIRMAMIPAEIHKQRYISLATFRKSGIAVNTPIWFAEDGNKLYFMTGSKLGKTKRLRNNPQVKIAPCTIRGKITGPEFAGTARLLPPEEFDRVRKMIQAKYWLARVPFLWRNNDTYVEIAVA